MVAIVGPSGCGKSTLLRLASKLTSPSEGQIHVSDGHLRYVFQAATLLPWRTGGAHAGSASGAAPPRPGRRGPANGHLLPALAGTPRAAPARRAADAIALTGLG